MGPKKTDAFCWKNGKRKISVSIYMPHPQLLLPPLSLLLQLPLHEGFIVGAELHAGCKKSVQIIFLHNFCQHLKTLVFSTYPSRTSHGVGSTTIILGIYVLLQVFSPQEQPRHISSAAALLLGWCFSFCNGFRSGFLAMELTAPMSSSASWAVANSTSTHPLYNNPSLQDAMEFSAENPIPERALCCFRFITKQLLNHAPS